MNLPLLTPDRRTTDLTTEPQVAAAVAQLLPLDLHDVTNCFAQCTSKMVITGLSNGSIMMALPLANLAGKIGTKQMDNGDSQLPRLGRELAGAAKQAGVKGVFHSDELPAYGVEAEQVKHVRSELKLTDSDAFILCLAPRWQAELALESVLHRARLAWHRIPQEVRNVVVKKGAPEDGTTSPMRPLPGGARMYPETDIPSFTLSNQEWLTILENLPMSDDERNMRMQQFEISQDQSKQIIARQLDDIFVDNIGDLPHKGLATLLLENDTVNPQLLANVLRAKEAGHLSRESMNEIVTKLIGSNPTVEEIAEYAEKNGYKPANVADLASVVDSIIAQRIDFVKERGMGAMGPLMGIVMQESAGADGKQVSALLRVAIQKAIE